MKASVLVKEVIRDRIKKNDVLRFEGILQNVATLRGHILDMPLRYYFDGGFDAKLVDRTTGEVVYESWEEWTLIDIPGISGPKPEFFQRYTLEELRRKGANI